MTRLVLRLVKFRKLQGQIHQFLELRQIIITANLHIRRCKIIRRNSSKCHKPISNRLTRRSLISRYSLITNNKAKFIIGHSRLILARVFIPILTPFRQHHRPHKLIAMMLTNFTCRQLIKLMLSLCSQFKIIEQSLIESEKTVSISAPSIVLFAF